MRAHSVYDHAARLAGGGYDLAARTHAECINSAFAACIRKRIFGMAETFVARMGAEHGAVDILCQMLDTHADRKRLRLRCVAV